MKKVIFCFIQIFILIPLVFSQTPQYYNYNTTNSGNTFPLGTTSGRMVQWLALPGDINQPSAAPSGYITKLYLMVAANFGPITYTNLSVLMGQSTITAFTTGSFYTGSRDTVYHKTSVSLTGVLQNWLELTLDSSFLYDNTKSLIVQVEQLGASGSALYSLGNTYLTGKRRNYSTTPPPFSVQGQDAYVYNFGVNIEPATGIGTNNNPQLPNSYKLEQNYPNPFNPATTINYEIPKTGLVTLKIYDLVGKEVAVLVNEVKNPGRYNIDFDGTTLTSGVYFYKLESNGFSSTKKLILVK